MLQSKTIIPTTKDVDTTQIKSYQIMQKAGLAKQNAAGVYTYYPLANQVIENIKKIIREELENIHATEMLLPVMQNKELWEITDRWDKYGDNLMKFKDRHGRDFCLAPTAEEIVVDSLKNILTSYKKLPMNMYQIQTKFRDEFRPRYGLMRGREFLMKDGYSFHATEESLKETYEDYIKAYTKIFARLDLPIRIVSADSGEIGGDVSSEFMVTSEVGEDTIFYCSNCDYSANQEKAESNFKDFKNIEQKNQEKIHTPNIKTIKELEQFFNLEKHHFIKTIVLNVENKPVLILIRGDYELNEVKLSKLFENYELATDAFLEENKLLKGFVGPNKDLTMYFDHSVANITQAVVGANEENYHIKNFNIKEIAQNIVDVRNVEIFDTCIKCNSNLESAKTVEAAHVFMLGDFYSKKMNATFINETGRPAHFLMGCYGLGVSRVLMALLEKHADESSILWPIEVSPYDYHILIVNAKKEDQVLAAHKIYNTLKQRGFKVLLDDRQDSIGSKFKDSDLIGIGKRIVVGKDIIENLVEYTNRYENSKELLSVEKI